jgi:chromosome segregation ATPase
MSEEHEHQEDSDNKSIVDALSTLGWVEEDDEEEIISAEDNLEEQIIFFRDENKRLIGEINQKNEIVHKLEVDIQDLIEKTEGKTMQSQAVQKLYETIEEKNDEIENLNLLLDEQSKKLNRIINDQIDRIKELLEQIEEFKSNDTDNQDLNKNLQEKDNKIKELMEQLKYLESDSIHKSKFEKLEVLLERKDEIITEKEKEIFSNENSLKTANKKIQDLQQQFETVNLMKKDLEKKTERNKTLVVELEGLKQKILSNQDLIVHIEKKLEIAHKSSGSLTGKFEIELGSIRNMLDDRDEEIKGLIEEKRKIQIEQEDSKRREEKINIEILQMKDENIKMESEIVELKKKIKLMRRDLKKA